MQERSVAMVLILTIITLGIYGIVWMVKTKNEMVSMGAEVPTAWLIIVPIASIWWMWKWSGGVQHATRGGMSQPIAFILLFLLGVIGMAIIQAEFNKVKALPQARMAA